MFTSPKALTRPTRSPVVPPTTMVRTAQELISAPAQRLRSTASTRTNLTLSTGARWSPTRSFRLPGHGKSGGGLPIYIIPITGGLDCLDYSGNELVLPMRTTPSCPVRTGRIGTITHKNSNELPGALDGKFTYVSAFNVDVTPALIGTMTSDCKFQLPARKKPTSPSCIGMARSG